MPDNNAFLLDDKSNLLLTIDTYWNDSASSDFVSG